MEEILKELLKYGFPGVVCAALFTLDVYLVRFVTRKLTSVIENNTKTMTELTIVIEERQKRRE